MPAVVSNCDFALAARSLGANNRRIIVQHILPNVTGLIIVASTLDIASVVVNEAVLSLLGLGLLLHVATVAVLYAGRHRPAMGPGMESQKA